MKVRCDSALVCCSELTPHPPPILQQCGCGYGRGADSEPVESKEDLGTGDTATPGPGFDKDGGMCLRFTSSVGAPG